LVDRIVTLPCTAIQDAEKDVQWQVTNSPFYTVERAVSYKLVVFDNNETNTEQTGLRQEYLAERLGVGQVADSRLESRDDVLVSTLRNAISSPLLPSNVLSPS